jgi:hypothetical protein
MAGGSGTPYMTIGSASNTGGFINYDLTNSVLGLGHHGATVVMNIKAGNVGIGTTNPSTNKLVVVGDIRVGTSGTNGCLERFDGAALTGSCSSDIQLKRNINPITNVLDKFIQLNPVTFNWRDTEFPARGFGTGTVRGLIAQDVELLFPELVGIDSRGYKTVNYGVDMTMLSIQAIRELDARVGQIATSTGLLALGPNALPHCVTGDTRLRRRRRRLGVDIGDADIDYDYDEVRIDEVESGDEIMSLNEQTGRVEFSRVNALMNMGVQEIYELKTKSGRIIRTTSTHPYLINLRAQKRLVLEQESTAQKLTKVMRSVANYITNSQLTPEKSENRETFTPLGRDMESRQPKKTYN